jgi:HAD superfamily hydrolase (TIGR01549 family)
MIKAIFFDLHGTLAYFTRARHDMHVMAAHDCGVDVPSEAIRQSLPLVDGSWKNIVVGQGRGVRSKSDKMTLGALYEQELLRLAGVEVTLEVAARIIGEFWKLMTRFVPYDDSIPTLKILKERGYTVGILTNMAGGDVNILCRNLGFAPYIKVAVSSEEIGSGKPDAPIFLAALERAGVKADEAIYIGDQYNIDVLGARGVGIRPVFLDRENSSPQITDCPRIQSLVQVVDLL